MSHCFLWLARKTIDAFVSTHTPDFQRVRIDDLADLDWPAYGMRAGYSAPTQARTSSHQVFSLHPAAPS